MTIPDEMVNHHYYEIDLRDIWQYEREAFFKQEISYEYADYLQSKIRKLIIDEDPKRGHKKGQPNEYTYSKYYKRFYEKKGLIEKEFMLDFFFDHETLYSYDKTLIINRKTSNYDYWFTLKLRQYDSNLLEIDNFLNYQIKSCFDNNYASFSRFLKLLVRQNSQDKHISSEVIFTVEEWILINSKKEESPINVLNSNPDVTEKKRIERKSNKNFIRSARKFDSFELIEFKKNTDYFTKNASNISEIISQLKKNKFIYDEPYWDRFVKIFSGEKIVPSERINWKASFQELNLFVSLLEYDLKKIEPLKNEIWVTTLKCFTKDGADISITQVRDANSSKKRKKLLLSILEKL
ncbi:MAG: hypothetical protein IPP32_16735 [Bacteroidetes bacterium]|nr:hypothetical protein [Bacteroidota bacterium]